MLGTYISAEGKDVIIIGGGDTGNDYCVGTSACVTAATVSPSSRSCPPACRTPSRQSLAGMGPDERTDYGQEEAVAIFGLDPRVRHSTKTIVGDEWTGQEVHTVRVTLQRKGGRMVSGCPGTEQVSPAQLVLLAMGFVGPEQALFGQLGCRAGRAQ